jgi:hypothetical protein
MCAWLVLLDASVNVLGFSHVKAPAIQFKHVHPSSFGSRLLSMPLQARVFDHAFILTAPRRYQPAAGCRLLLLLLHRLCPPIGPAGVALSIAARRALITITVEDNNNVLTSFCSSRSCAAAIHRIVHVSSLPCCSWMGLAPLELLPPFQRLLSVSPGPFDLGQRQMRSGCGIVSGDRCGAWRFAAGLGRYAPAFHLRHRHLNRFHLLSVDLLQVDLHFDHLRP